MWSEGDERLISRFDAVDNPDNLDARPELWPFALTSSFRGRDVDLAEPELREWMQQVAWKAPAIGKNDRLQEILIQRFEVPLVHVEYTFGGARGSIDVLLGRTTSVIENSTSRTPFTIRLLCAALVTGGACLWGVGLYLWYIGRHPWYADQTAGFGLLPVSLILTVAAPLLVAHVLLPVHARSRSQIVVTGSAITLMLFGQLALANGGNPSVASAEAHVSRGDTTSAIHEAAAAADLGFDTQAAGELHDRLVVEQLAQTETTDECWQLSQGRFFTQDGSQQAQTLAVARLKASIAERLDAENAESVDADLQRISLVVPSDSDIGSLSSRLHIVNALQCIAATDSGCTAREVAFARQFGAGEAELRALNDRIDLLVGAKIDSLWAEIELLKVAPASVDACEAIMPLIRVVEAASVSPAGRYPTSAVVQKACDQTSARLKAAEEKALYLEQKKAEAEARARARRPLRCGDGSYSPTCTCGGPRKGCCSSHGGVAGCY